MSKKPLKGCEIGEVMDALIPRRGRPPIDLSTPRGVLEELERLYRDTRHGRLDAQRATRLAYLLSLMLRAHETVKEAADGKIVVQIITPDADVY